jgi:hypothetical protein
MSAKPEWRNDEADASAASEANASANNPESLRR